MSETIEPPTFLSILPTHAISTVIAADRGDILGKLVEELRDFQADATTAKGRKEARSKAYKVSLAKGELVRVAETLKEDAQKTIKSVNAEIKVIEEKMDEIRDNIKAPVEEYEAREERRVAAHQKALADLQEAPAYFQLGNKSVAEIERRLVWLREQPPRDWEEFSIKAIKVLTEEIARTEALLAAEVKREADAAELARLRAAEAERQARDAERQRAERERLVAEQAAEAARMEALRLAAEERARIEREAAEREAKAVRDAKEAEEREAKALREAKEAEERAVRAEIAQQKAAVEAQEAEARRKKEQHQNHIRSLIRHIVDCGNGFIDGKTYPYPILFRELEEKVVVDDTYGEFRREAEEAKGEALNKLRYSQEKQRKRTEDDARQAEQVRMAAIIAERERVAAEAVQKKRVDELRAADQNRRRKINSEILARFVQLGLSEDLGKSVIMAVAKKTVPHMSINY